MDKKALSGKQMLLLAILALAAIALLFYLRPAPQPGAGLTIYDSINVTEHVPYPHTG
ncbi:MAG: hypothetical protein ABH829_03950 [archaeon]